MFNIKGKQIVVPPVHGLPQIEEIELSWPSDDKSILWRWATKARIWKAESMVQASSHASAKQLIPCTIILVLLGLDLGMAIASYKQFGWRMYSKIACDFRTKSGLSKQRTHLLIHSFLTILKVDVLVRLYSMSLQCQTVPSNISWLKTYFYTSPLDAIESAL